MAGSTHLLPQFQPWCEARNPHVVQQTGPKHAAPQPAALQHPLAARRPTHLRETPSENEPMSPEKGLPFNQKEISSEPTINFQGFGKLEFVNTLLRKGRSLVTEHNCSTEGRKFAKATLAYSSAVFNSTPISNSIDWNLLKLLIQSRPNTKCSYKVAQIRICNTNQELEPLESS